LEVLIWLKPKNWLIRDIQLIDSWFFSDFLVGEKNGEGALRIDLTASGSEVRNLAD
jgi:hypothetical protein